MNHVAADRTIGRTTHFISSDVYRQKGFGDNHPLAIPRVGTVMALCETLGWISESGYEASPRASTDQLSRYHDLAYIEAIQRADAAGKADNELRQEYCLGTRENPVFAGMFERARTSCGGSILAAQLALQGRVGFNPAGGTHHGMPGRAHGFCYFNDPVMAILELLEGGVERVFYADLDAHHGDGVEAAFADDSRVLTVSIHETGRWPFSGDPTDRAGGFSRNLPVPRNFNDSELDYLMTNAVLPLANAFDPEVVVIVCGADGLKGDPLSTMRLSNGALWRAVGQLISLTKGAVVLGGGGYNPWTVARCWAGLWAVLTDVTIPPCLPESAARLLKSLDCDLVDEEDREPGWTTTIADPLAPGPIRNAVRSLPPVVLAA